MQDIVRTPRGVGVARTVSVGWVSGDVGMGGAIGSSHEGEVVGLVDRTLQPIVRAYWDPQPPDDDGDEPHPKGAHTLTVRVETLPYVRERIDDGEDEGDDDPRNGCRCSNGPGVGLFESVDETLPPVVVLG